MDINKIAIINGCVLQNTMISKIFYNSIDFSICNIADVSNIDNKNVFFTNVVL